MSWLQRLQSESAVRLARTGLPRRVLRHLIFSHDVGVGSRVLDVGCGTGELVRFFHELGMKASGIASATEKLRLAREAAAELEFLEFHAIADGQLEARTFDLVIVRDSATYAEDMFSSEACSTTASLIEALRPGGSLVFVQQDDSAPGSKKACHAASCYSRHLRMFPGSCKTAEFAASHGSGEGWRRMFTPFAPAGVLTATYCRPIESATQYDWHALGITAAESHRGRCCFGAQQASAARRAA